MSDIANATFILEARSVAIEIAAGSHQVVSSCPKDCSAQQGMLPAPCSHPCCAPGPLPDPDKEESIVVPGMIHKQMCVSIFTDRNDNSCWKKQPCTGSGKAKLNTQMSI